MLFRQRLSFCLICNYLAFILIQHDPWLDPRILSKQSQVQLRQTFLVCKGSVLVGYDSLGHASEAFVLEHGHKGYKKDAFVLHGFQEIIIILELLSRVSLPRMLLVELLLIIEVHLYLKIINHIASILSTPLLERKDFVHLRDV